MAIFQCRITLTLVALLALCSVHPAHAETITLNFRLDVTGHRCFWGDCPAVGSSVPLTVRFDSAVTGGFDGTFQSSRQYGTPSFELPLPGQGQTGVIPFDTFTGQGRFGWSPTQWQHTAELAGGEEFQDRFDEFDDPLLAWRFYMHKEALQAAKPTLSARAYASFLGTTPTYFNYGFETSTASGVYDGTATLVTDLQPISEPASLLLLTTGLCAFGARRWRGRSTVAR